LSLLGRVAMSFLNLAADGAQWAAAIRALLRAVDTRTITEAQAIAWLRDAIAAVDGGRAIPFVRSPSSPTPPAPPALPEWRRGGRGRSTRGRR